MLGSVPWKTEIRTNVDIIRNLTIWNSTFDTNIMELGHFVGMMLSHVVYSLDVTKTLGMTSCAGRTER